jgi:hypothetical protein
MAWKMAEEEGIQGAFTCVPEMLQFPSHFARISLPSITISRTFAPAIFPIFTLSSRIFPATLLAILFSLSIWLQFCTGQVGKGSKWIKKCYALDPDDPYPYISLFLPVAGLSKWKGHIKPEGQMVSSGGPTGSKAEIFL